MTTEHKPHSSLASVLAREAVAAAEKYATFDNDIAVLARGFLDLEEQLEATQAALQRIADEYTEIWQAGKWAREALNPASSPLCECGHSIENHHGDPMTVAKSPCRATVYTEAPLGGGNAFTCHCRDYVPASDPDGAYWRAQGGVPNQDTREGA